MKVKPIIATMFMVGLVGGSVIAATQRGDVLNLRDRYVNQGSGSSTGNWLLDHTKVGAQLNVDAGMSNRTRLDQSGRQGISGSFINANSTSGSAVTSITNMMPAGDKMSSDLLLNNSEVSADFMPADWVNAHIEINGSDANNVNNSNPRLNVDVARVTFGNLAMSPFYASVGRDYVAFGSYGDAHPLTPSLTQQLSQINATQVAVGFAQPCGFSASGYMFRGIRKAYNTFTPSAGVTTVSSVNAFTNNGGLDGSYDWGDGQGVTGVNLNLGWLYNMADAYAIAPVISSGTSMYSKAVGGFTATASGYYRQVDAKISYVGAVSRFASNNDNLAFNGAQSEPKAVGLEVGYGFNTLGHEHRIAVGYQRSYQSLAIGLPESRWEGDWTVSLAKNTNLQLQYTHDSDYSTGTTGNATTGSALAYAAGFLRGTTTPTSAVRGTGLNAETFKARVTVDLL